jgi:hypothetical protein
MLTLPGDNRDDYSPIVNRRDYAWSQGRRLAFYVALNVEDFALNLCRRTLSFSAAATRIEYETIRAFQVLLKHHALVGQFFAWRTYQMHQPHVAITQWFPESQENRPSMGKPTLNLMVAADLAGELEYHIPVWPGENS